MKLGDRVNVSVDVIPSGSLSLDQALGIGGYPKGRIIEIYGPESSGKTTLALHAIAECQKAGGRCAFIDAENAIDPVYAKNLGVDIDELILSQPDSGEQALDICELLVKSGAIDLIVVDSVAALVPQAELDEREKLNLLFRGSLIFQRNPVDLTGVVQGDEGGLFYRQIVFFRGNHRVPHTMTAFIRIQLCLYRKPAGGPNAVAVFHIEIPSARIRGHIVVTVTC